jgi:hypothetical protein
MLADRQVHAQVQKGVAAALGSFIHGTQRFVHIGQVGVVFGVFVDPLACYGFYSF